MAAANRDTARERFLNYLLPVIAYAAFIFYVSSIYGQDIPGLFPGQDILFHAIEYAIFAWLINRAIKEYRPGQNKMKRLLWVLVFALTYAVLDEFHQSFVPARSASLSDLGVDGIGSFLGAILYQWRK